MPTADKDFAAELANVRRDFIRSLEPRVVRLSALQPASPTARMTLTARAEIQAIAHKLAGSCASFGLKVIGDAAMALEDKLIIAKAEPNVFIAGDVEELIDFCVAAIFSVQ